MIEIKTLTQHDFDTFENHNPHYSKVIGNFIDENKHSASYYIGKYLREQTITPYLGWDGQVYPQFTIKTTYANRK